MDILNKFFNDCNGSFWFDKNGWGTDGICSWHGIKCVPGQQSVEEIVLGTNNVECIPPMELFLLPDLKKLSLYGNSVKMSFFLIEKATKLEELVLDRTATDELKGIEKAPNLKRLSLRDCDIDGKFPSELLALTSLEYLSLAENRITGTLPGNLSGLNNLEVLVLKDNEFMGGLDNANFPASLKMIDLSGNNLDGPVPLNFLENLHSYELDLDLSDNLLTGTVPSTLERFGKLNVELRENFFVEIDDDLCKMVLWNDGAVREYGCNALLCPRGTSAKTGKQTSSADSCNPCAEAEYLGNSECFGEHGSARSLRLTSYIVSMVILIVSTYVFI